MYQIKDWCFLCAAENNADVAIQSLDETTRENIGQFSIINFTLIGVPSSICRNCHTFLIDFETRKERYARAEQMYMELLRMRNVVGIRDKYNMTDDQDDEPEMSQDETRMREHHEYIEVYEQEVEEVAVEVTRKPEIAQPAATVIVTKIKKDSGRQHRVNAGNVSMRRSVKTEAPAKLHKILNPTIHVATNTRMALFKCDHCAHSSSTKTAMERHMMQIHLKPSANAFKCETCFKTFAKKIILQNHEKTHLLQRPAFDCHQCGKLLSSQTAVNNHIKWIHSGKREFVCATETCLKKFATKGSLKEHEKIHSDFKGHVCMICKKTYKTASTLTQHLDTHGETEYHCNECGLRLNSKRTLRQHMLKHSDVVKFTCEICNAQFKRPKAYKEHLLSVHTEIKAYKCDWCPKTFSNGANCRKHKKEAHPTQLLKLDKKNLKTVVKLPKIHELLTIGHETHTQLPNKSK